MGILIDGENNFQSSYFVKNSAQVANGQHVKSSIDSQ